VTRTGLLLISTLLSLSVSLVGQIAGWQTFAPVAVIGLALVWLLPGYALLAALFPRGVGSLVRAALAVPCSFLLCIGVGVVRDRIPVGLHSPGFAVSLALLTLAFTAAAEARRLASPSSGAPTFGRSAWLALLRPRPEQLAAPAFGLLFLLGLGAWARNGLSEAISPPAKPFTVLAVDQQRQILVDNEEGVSASYRLELASSGQTLASWPLVQLTPGGHWTQALPELPAGDGDVQLSLFRGHDAQPYRTLILRPGEA
jgi:hypothetical protein